LDIDLAGREYHSQWTIEFWMKMILNQHDTAYRDDSLYLISHDASCTWDTQISIHAYYHVGDQKHYLESTVGGTTL